MKIKKVQLNKKALRKSFWGSLARLIGVGLGAGAGSLLKGLVGDGFEGWGLAFFMAVASFALLWVAEYERESGE